MVAHVFWHINPRAALCQSKRPVTSPETPFNEPITTLNEVLVVILAGVHVITRIPRMNVDFALTIKGRIGTRHTHLRNGQNQRACNKRYCKKIIVVNSKKNIINKFLFYLPF